MSNHKFLRYKLNIDDVVNMQKLCKVVSKHNVLPKDIAGTPVLDVE